MIDNPTLIALLQGLIGALFAAYTGAGFASFSMWQHWWIAVLFITTFFWRWVAVSKPA